MRDARDDSLDGSSDGGFARDNEFFIANASYKMIIITLTLPVKILGKRMNFQSKGGRFL